MDISRHWRLRKQRYALEGEICPHCGARLFPPRDVCPHCGLEAKTTYTFVGTGVVVSWTRVRQAPTHFEEQTPYVVALVQLDEDPMLTAQLTDLGNVQPYAGMKVEMVTRKLRNDKGDRGLIVYGYKFRPVLERAVA